MARTVKEIMNPIEEYDRIDVDAPLSDALAILKRNHEKIKAGDPGRFHKTLLVTDASKKIVGKFSIYDLTRGLVPESAKVPEISRAFYAMLSSRALEVADEVGEFQEHFKWLHNTFLELVKQEANKKVKDIMSPFHAVLKEDDKMNQAIYTLFKEGVRQQLVARDDKIVGVVNLMCVFRELLETIGPETGVA
ncbi:MAG: CBS domain-containing protein [Deltaproteobacteria bacterium]|nr:CBS domain-containing protein [Deltaproteobacteria bacterium]MBW1794309.1 CBS domain-containing protein [Deltaproteobacteria bacterium]MBW2329432.1 CBS domain-containing protein [Deltaproteobacteria bacterium]